MVRELYRKRCGVQNPVCRKICSREEVEAPDTCDELRKIMSMNENMVVCFLKVLEQLKPDLVYVDAADVKAERFAYNLRRQYEKTSPAHAKEIEIISMHQATRSILWSRQLQLLQRCTGTNLLRNSSRNGELTLAVVIPQTRRQKDSC
jgi:hypothetical protein